MDGQEREDKKEFLLTPLTEKGDSPTPGRERRDTRRREWEARLESMKELGGTGNDLGKDSKKDEEQQGGNPQSDRVGEPPREEEGQELRRIGGKGGAGQGLKGRQSIQLVLVSQKSVRGTTDPPSANF